MVKPFFHLKGNTIVLIDWANVFHAQRKNGWNIDLSKLRSFLVSHEHVSDIAFFHGTDTHEKSKQFLNEVKDMGYRVITKNVKYVPITTDHLGNPLKEPFLRRKCDFDVEISKEILLHLDQYHSFILFSGDGDYAPIFDVLRMRKKQSILLFSKGALGREYIEDEKRRNAMFLCPLERLRPFIQF